MNNVYGRISIDRITAIGFLGRTNKTLGRMLKGGNGSSKGFTLLDGNTHIAFLQPLEMKGMWRIEFNPNNISKDSDGYKNLIYILSLLKNKHLSRIDIAFDIFNLEDFMNYRLFVNGTNITKYYSRNHKLSTLYYGSAKSNKRIRQYDKARERRDKGVKVNKHWGRLEITLSKKSLCNNWKKYSFEMINNFKMPAILSLKPSERAMVNAIMTGLVNYSELGSQTTRLKYKRIIKHLKDKDGIQDLLKETFLNGINDLDKEIEMYLS